jgi:hypothetical protein
MQENLYKIVNGQFQVSAEGLCPGVAFTDEFDNDFVTVFSRFLEFDHAGERAVTLYQKFLIEKGTGELLWKKDYSTNVNADEYMGADPVNHFSEFGKLFQEPGAGRVTEIQFFFKVLNGEYPGVSLNTFHFQTIKTLEGLI